MPRKNSAPLPESLRYLQPVVRALAKLPSDKFEDADLSAFEAVLRKRLRGLDEDAATDALLKDFTALERYLKSLATPNLAAHGVQGLLFGVVTTDWARELVRPAPPKPRAPRIDFDPPPGWKMKAVPFRLNLKKGKFDGEITAVEKDAFEELKGYCAQLPKALRATRKVKSKSQRVSFKKVSRKKYVLWDIFIEAKYVTYFLKVPGGLLHIELSSIGPEIDETPFEAKLHTLRLTPPK